MTEQELKLQHGEEKYGIYMNTFGYEGDDSESDTDLDMMAYPYLDYRNIRKPELLSP